MNGDIECKYYVCLMFMLHCGINSPQFCCMVGFEVYRLTHFVVFFSTVNKICLHMFEYGINLYTVFFVHSMVKEATMLHIVTELRNYRKSLEERIDASRRCSANLFSNEQTIVVGDNRQSVIQSHRKERTLTTKNSRRSTDENPLPDLVRSHNSSNTFVLQASPCAIPAGKISLVTSGIKLPIPSPIDARPPSKLSPKTINRQFSVDQYGVLDLSTKSHDASPGYSYARDYHCQSNLANYFLGGDDSEGEQVLDLSKNSSVSVTPPSSRTTGVQLPSFGAAKSILRPSTGSRPKKTRTRKRCPTNLDRMLKWSVNDVAKFASGITGCEEYSEVCLNSAAIFVHSTWGFGDWFP